MNIGELLRDEAKRSRTLEIIRMLDEMKKSAPEDGQKILEEASQKIAETYLRD